MALFRVTYYSTPSGRSPVEDFLEDLPKRARDKCIAQLDRLADGEFISGSRFTEKLRGDVYELRARHDGEQYRFFYATRGERVYVLHAIHKKTPKVPSADIDTAERRLAVWVESEREERS